jgi:hypothetical protein
LNIEMQTQPRHWELDVHLPTGTGNSHAFYTT